jgi:hypothetical protein
MATEWRNIEIPFAGVDQYTDAPHVVTGKLLEAENIRFRSPPSMEKRLGCKAKTTDAKLSTSAAAEAITEPRRLVRHGDSSLIATRESLFVYSPTTDVWLKRGQLSSCHVDRQRVWANNTETQNNWSAATLDGLTVYARTLAADGTFNVLITDAVTGRMLRTELLSTNGDIVRVFAIGSLIYIFVGVHAVSGQLQYVTINPSDPYAVLATTGITGLTASMSSPAMAIAPVEENASALVLAYRSSAAGNPLVVDRCSLSTNTVVSSYTSGVLFPINTIAVHAHENEGVLVVCDTDMGAGLVGMHGYVMHPYLSSQTLVQLKPGLVDSNHYWAGITRSKANERVVTWQRFVDDGQPAGALAVRTSYRDLLVAGVHMVTKVVTSNSWDGRSSLRPASTPFTLTDGRVLVWAAYVSDVMGNPRGAAAVEQEAMTSPMGGDQSTLFLLQLTDTFGAFDVHWDATAARGIALASDNFNFVPDTMAAVDGRTVLPIALKSRLEYAGGDDETILITRSVLELVAADFSPSPAHENRPWGGGTVFAGGRPSWYDGSHCYELGFAWRPGNFWLWRSTGVTSGLVPFAIDGEPCRVQFQQCYERLDAAGLIHRSGPSETLTNEQSTDTVDRFRSVFLYVGDEVLTEARNSLGVAGQDAKSIRLVPYRTEANGTAFYRAEEPPALGFDSWVAGALPKLSLYGEIVGSVSPAELDADIVTHDLLYTSGGILENTGLPPCKLIETHQNRLWLGGLEEPDLIWFSQPYVWGEGPRFNEALSLRLKMPVKAFANLESQLVVFGEDDIQVIIGNGPPATGGLDIGFQIGDVASDVGCINPRSVVVFRDGVMFMSKKGMFKLGRGMDVTHAGGPARMLFERYPDITSARVIPEHSEIIWTCTNAANTEAIRVVWNYEINQWTHDTIEYGHGVDDGIEAFKPIDALVVYDEGQEKDTYAMLMGNGAVLRETADWYLDVENPVATMFVTPWIRLASLQDWLRLKGLALLYERTGKFGLTIEAAYDTDPDTWHDLATFTTDEIDEILEDQLLVDFERQVCRGIKLRFTELPILPGNLYRGGAGLEAIGPKYISLLVEGGFEGRGRFRTPDHGRK